MRESSEVLHTFAFAHQAHGEIGQTRTFTGEPYITHPVEVAHLLATVLGVDDLVLLKASILHDVIEDTNVTESRLRSVFGSEVTDLVLEVTNVATPADGNRAARVKINHDHLAGATARGQTLKMADSTINLRGCAASSTGFARDYIPEKADLLPILKDGDARMRGLYEQTLSTETILLNDMDARGLKTMLPASPGDLRLIVNQRVAECYGQMETITRMVDEVYH